MQKRNQIFQQLGLLLLAVVLVASCQKDGGYINYVKQPPQIDANVYDYLQSKPGVYDSMVLVIDRVGLKRILSSTKVTVFALTNASYTAALRNLNILRQKQGKAPVSLSSLDQQHLDTLMCRYIVPGFFTTDSLVAFPDGFTTTSLKYGGGANMQLFTETASGMAAGGPKYIIYSDTKGSFYINKWVRANTMSMDTYLRNGVVHVLSGDHEFGFNEFITRFNK
ncbi:hypothetical protein SAMN05444266_10456 [Chitinophaga jiangningensis]|uniref:Fasciclin domain-containing protein n=1 Tax=Chitinophaga jiangningensis TaxID=1419482 RepID=A0A1M7BT73_9BACT|nr:hypothetical protein [Chitinophaga jiangningensis]SHL58225.1 hypothetical protein SAMN05444266_10456 [Chitinophaga jiangningensis]